MTKSGKKHVRMRSQNALRVVMVGFLFYLLLCVAGPLYLLFKSSSVDLDRFKPPHYVPKLLPLDAHERITALNAYHTHFNAFGSRNRFEVTREDKNLIYLLGDAPLFGYGLADHDTVAHHLNRIDPTHKYVNLAQPATNVLDSLTRYRLTREKTTAPRAIIVQTVLQNNIIASALVKQKIINEVRRDHRLLLFPVSLFIDQEWLVKHYYKKFTEQMLRDLSLARFEAYVGRPLRELAQEARRVRAPLFVIEYTGAAANPDYHRELGRLCASLGASLHKVEELISPEKRDIQPGGHPGPGMNRIIAEMLSAAVNRRATAAAAARAAPPAAAPGPPPGPAAPPAR